MNCPVCNVTLNMAERSGVEIDYCPQCRGIWLDRGELDKLIERATIAQTEAPATVDFTVAERDRYARPAYKHHDHDDDDDDDDDRRRAYANPRNRKREGFLGRLFDFD